jgi:hypothetical protein
MARLLALAAALLLALAVAAPAAAADPDRPFKGASIGADTMGPPLDCPEWAQWRYTSDGWANVTHLGRVTMHVTHCSAMTSQDGGVFGAGVLTLTAPNGDRLVLRDWGTFVVTWKGGPTPYDSTIDLHWEVIGGTGRFADATGHGTGSGYGILADGRTSVTYRGVLGY